MVDPPPQNIGNDAELNYYLIPGMGADDRLYIHFDLAHGKMHKLKWWPHDKSTNLAEYAALLSQQITTHNNVIIGSSMGGMVAVEIAKQIKPLATILISAPVGRHEFPRSLKMLHALRVHRMLTPGRVSRITSMADLFMSFKTDDQRQLFYEMLKGNGSEFLLFSLGAVLSWENRIAPEGNFIQIIGTRDRLFSHRKMRKAITIEGSGHFTTYERGKEVSAIINAFIEEKILPGLQRK